MYLIAYCTGNLIGPQTFVSSQAPQYIGAKVGMIAGSSVVLLSLICLYFSLCLGKQKRIQGRWLI